MSLFDNEFFPTPEEVIRKMVEPYADRLETATILEPSAGNGAIIDFITTTGVPCVMQTQRGTEYSHTVKANPRRVYAVERNPELQMILREKSYRIAGDDFLVFRPDIRFDLCLMNPPFSCGDKHLLHAWDILQGGDIACLLNAETVRNQCTETRKRLGRIIAEHGTTEFLGQCFKDADHQTDVEVALVRLHKENSANPFKLDFDGSAEKGVDFGEVTSSGESLEQSSRLDAYIRSWNMAKDAAVEYIRARQKLRFFLDAFLDANNKGNATKSEPVRVIDDVLNGDKIGEADTMARAYNEFVEEAKKCAWNVIFRQIGIEKYMTSRLRDNLNKFKDDQSSMEISKENIMGLLKYIFTNVNTIMDNAVVEVYDMFTRYFKGNTSFTEGWKTNKRFSCNRKVILPNAVSAGFMPQRYGYNRKFSTEYSSRLELQDIDKAMCWLTGRQFESLTGEIDIPGQGKAPCPADSTIEQTVRRIDVGDQEWHESAFFRVKCFKKGTVHLEFKDEALWTKFNLTVNQGKNLVGDGEAA